MGARQRRPWRRVETPQLWPAGCGRGCGKAKLCAENGQCPLRVFAQRHKGARPRECPRLSSSRGRPRPPAGLEPPPEQERTPIGVGNGGYWGALGGSGRTWEDQGEPWTGRRAHTPLGSEPASMRVPAFCPAWEDMAGVLSDPALERRWAPQSRVESMVGWGGTCRGRRWVSWGLTRTGRHFAVP